MKRTIRARIVSIAASAAILLGGCATIQGIRQDSLDLIQVASSTFVPASYGNLVTKFVDVLKKAPEPTPGSTTTPPTNPVASAGGSAIDASPSAPSPPLSTPSVATSPVSVTTTSPPDQTTPLSVEFDVVKQALVGGSSVALPVKEGDVLRDGGGDPQRGDNYRVLFRANLPCWVYVVQVDTAASIFRLFPGELSGNEQNPVAANRAYAIPPDGPEPWLFLDQNKGVETIYFFASLRPKPELEDLLEQLEKEKPATPPPVSIERPILATRGVAGKRPGQERKVELSSGRVASIPTNLFTLESKSSEILVTRSFRHE